MQKKLLVLNWKSNKTIAQALDYLDNAQDTLRQADESFQILICPSFTLLPPMHEHITKLSLPVQLGAQDISQFDVGAYTGEVNASQIKELCNYVLIGHSERRKYFNETMNEFTKKAEQANQEDLKIIFCAATAGELLEGAFATAYEPPSAISTLGGTPETPDAVEQVLSEIKSRTNTIALYGGSVDAQSAQSYLSKDSVNGLLVGKASLETSFLTACL